MEHLGPLTLLPALVAIVLALVTRQVLVALCGGVWLGAALLWWASSTARRDLARHDRAHGPSLVELPTE